MNERFLHASVVSHFYHVFILFFRLVESLLEVFFSVSVIFLVRIFASLVGKGHYI